MNSANMLWMTPSTICLAYFPSNDLDDMLKKTKPSGVCQLTGRASENDQSSMDQHLLPSQIPSHETNKKENSKKVNPGLIYMYHTALPIVHEINSELLPFSIVDLN